MLKTKYSELYNKVEINKKNFERIISEFNKTTNFDNKLKLAQIALTFATKYNTGYYTYSPLENFFCDYAQSIDIDNYNINFKPNTFLHVMTTGYKTGGHTQVVARWIENAPNTQSHSVVFINQGKEKLQNLENLTNAKNGKCIYLNEKLSLKDKALNLRELALNYQYIILHTHMDDPTATVAFGTEKFTRPILFYNHASHMFWIGKKISDLLLDILENDEITIIKRKINNKFPLGIPMKNINFKTTNKLELRKKLNIPLDRKIIISAGSGFKYNPICKDNFIEIGKKLINENTYLYVIGANKKHKMWKTAFKETKGHIIPLGLINFNAGYLDYIGMADLYIDSYPTCGYTALIDAISLGVPVLSLETILPQLDYLTKSNAYCKTIEELIEKTNKILNNSTYAQNIVEETQKSLKENLSLNAWNNKIENLLKIAPNTHKLNILPEDDDCKIYDISVMCNILENKNFSNYTHILTKEELKYGLQTKIQGLPFLFIINTYKFDKTTTKIIKLFNIQILKLVY